MFDMGTTRERLSDHPDRRHEWVEMTYSPKKEWKLTSETSFCDRVQTMARLESVNCRTGLPVLQWRGGGRFLGLPPRLFTARLHMHYAVWFDKNLVSYVDNFDRARFSILLDNTLVRCTFDPKRLDNGILGKALSELTQSDLDDMLEHVIGYLSTFKEELIQGRVASLPDLLADNVNYEFSMQEAYDDCRAIVSDGRSCPSDKANRRRTFLAYENMVRVPCRVDRCPSLCECSVRIETFVLSGQVTSCRCGITSIPIQMASDFHSARREVTKKGHLGV